MASATELDTSGEGDSISDRGDANVSRTFHVVVDAPDEGQREDPADFVLRSPELVGSGAVPMGSTHPHAAKDRAGLVAARYTVEEHAVYLNKIVRVEYAPLANFNFSANVPWLFSYSPGFGTRRANTIRTNIDPVTGARLDTTTDIDIGPRVYHKTPSDDGEELVGRFLATLPNTDEDGNGKPKLVYLSVDEKQRRRIKGYDVTYPIGSMTLTRQLRTYPEGIHSWLMDLRNTTNTNRFLSREPGRLKFVGPEVSSSPAPTELGSGGGTRGVVRVGSRSTAGLVWDMTLHFVDNSDVFDFTVNGQRRTFDFGIQDVWVEDGVEVPIVDRLSKSPFPKNATQISYYKYYFDYPFANILTVLNAYGV